MTFYGYARFYMDNCEIFPIKKCKIHLTFYCCSVIIKNVKSAIHFQTRRICVKNKIKEYRKMRKLTQDDLAKEVDVTRQTIISLENGKYVASLQLALKMAKFFNVSVEDLFSLEEE